MSDLVERLRDLERVEYELAHESDCPPEATANWKYAETCREAADRIAQLEKALDKMKRSRDRYRQAWEAEKTRAALEGK